MSSKHQYDHQELESTWQQKWNNDHSFCVKKEGEPYYVLEMFPYPSGDLHMGHVRNYTIGDVLARYQKMMGRNVLHPMGWDSLGLPAENQAIKEKIAPQIRTPKNIARMKLQMQRLGLAYDWEREIATYLPDYYRWNQWFFLKFYERGLVYRRRSMVNWCPGCNTILANEQVLADNTCWRGHTGVTTREVPEWAFRITAYAEELLHDLEQLDTWPERIVTQQRHWIGKSKGSELSFPVIGSDIIIKVFTTRIDTIYGCTYLVLAPEHEQVLSITQADQCSQIQAFIKKTKQVDRQERTNEQTPKEGIFTGAYALNPFTKKRIPIWIANFVVADYGTGAVMSVPAHDQRDFEFAQKYDLLIRPVIQPIDGSELPTPLHAAFTEDGRLSNSGEFDNLDSKTARDKMTLFAETKHIGKHAVTWHLRDWGFSRQRYWGTPIPVVHCESCGPVCVPETALPIVLPDFEAIELTGKGGAPLAKLTSFCETTCPQCQRPARRETDTMDTFVDSAWYFARYLSPSLKTDPFSPKEAKHWLPVNIYIGGPEHAVMHLLYFRFWTKVMRDMGLLDVDEPVRRLLTQGMVNAPAYKCKMHGYVAAKQVGHLPRENQICPVCQKVLTMAVEKMSKSKYNGIDPIELIKDYGADTARLYTLFAAPPEKDLEWNIEGVEGIYRFIGRLYRLMAHQAERVKGAIVPTSLQALKGADVEIRQAVHRTLSKVSEEIGERNHFNTAIAALMELVNKLYEHKLHEESKIDVGVIKETLLLTAQMLAPLAPHLAEEIWKQCGGKGLIVNTAWPVPDKEALKQNTMRIAVQVNGKLRGQIEVPVSYSECEVVKLAQAEVNVSKHLTGKDIMKQIFVPKRLLNFVVK